MTLAALELALRAASVALLLVLAASLLARFSQCACLPAARRGLRVGLGRACAELSVGVTSRVPLWHAPLIALSTGNIVVFWLFTRALFDDAFQPALVARSDLGAGDGLQLRGLRLDRAQRPCAVLGHGGQSDRARLHCACGRADDRLWPADLVERRRRVRVFIVCAAALYGGLNALLQIAVAGHRRRRCRRNDQCRRACLHRRGDRLCDDAR